MILSPWIRTGERRFLAAKYCGCGPAGVQSLGQEAAPGSPAVFGVIALVAGGKDAGMLRVLRLDADPVRRCGRRDFLPVLAVDGAQDGSFAAHHPADNFRR